MFICVVESVPVARYWVGFSLDARVRGSISCIWLVFMWCYLVVCGVYVVLAGCGVYVVCMSCVCGVYVLYMWCVLCM